MRILFLSMLVFHVVAGVLGIGSIVSVALLATMARRRRRGTAETFFWLRPLLRSSGISLGAMLVTGGILDFAMQGVFRSSWWFRGSVLLLLVTGALHGLSRRAMRTVAVNEASNDVVLRRVERIAYAMCVLIVAITVLMVVKPF
jgi:uncharacterized membrane protein